MEVNMVGMWQMEGETVKMFETYAFLQDTKVQGFFIPGIFCNFTMSDAVCFLELP